MSSNFVDNSPAVLAQIKSNTARALTAVGIEAVGITVDYMSTHYYRDIHQSGDLKRSISHKVDLGNKSVDIGTNMEYAPWVHDGTRRMVARPFLRDAIMDNTDIWQEIMAEYLSEGFK